MLVLEPTYTSASARKAMSTSAIVAQTSERARFQTLVVIFLAINAPARSLSFARSRVADLRIGDATSTNIVVLVVHVVVHVVVVVVIEERDAARCGSSASG